MNFPLFFKIALNVGCYSIFWLWNLSFLMVVFFGILPYIGVDLVIATFDGDVPLDFFITFVALLSVPTVCTFVGAKYLFRKPQELMRLFYGVEAPLFAWCLIRLFLIRELTAASSLVLGTILLCIAAFAVEVIFGYNNKHRHVAWLQMVAHSLMLIIGLYVSVFLLYYVLPSAFMLIVGFLSFQWLDSLGSALYYGGIFSFISLLLFFFSCSLFLGMPSAFATLYLHSGQKVLRLFAGQFGGKLTLVGVTAVVAIWLTLLTNFNLQPQVQAFALLEQFPNTNASRTELLAESKTIRQGLVNANLHPYRYVSTIEENNHIYAMYKDLFQLPDAAAQWFQNSYNLVMSPFLYQGSRNDVTQAEQLYAEFFDTPLQKAERKAVQHALQSTAIVDQAKAGLLNIDQNRVWLRRQEVNTTAHGDWADVEIYEVYENKTNDVEEIFYYFSLPESAAITGLWLGETANRDHRFPFQVSPRGAAQEVYNSQVRRARPIDPALLEQVGPRNYRLRAFPVPAPLSIREKRNGVQRATEMHLWLNYKVLRQDEGWALPSLQEKRNIFWTGYTKRLRNGKVVRGLGNQWLEAYLPAPKQASQGHTASLNNGYQITAQPLTNQIATLPKNKRFALILDTSYSMATQRQKVEETFAWLQKNGFADNKFANNDADLYLPDLEGKQPQRLDDINNFKTSKFTFYGSLSPQQMLQQFDQLRGDTAYDGIVVLTDGGSYELAKDGQTIPALSAPLWFVHLGEQMPPAYDDTTLKAIQDTRGGADSNLPNVIQRFAAQETLANSVVNVADGYIWQMLPNANPEAENSDFAPLAARQLVLGLSRQSQNSANTSLKELDAIHAVAKTYDIVTPYSSMIVLVNDQQRDLLKQAETRDDRFDREIETGQEDLNQPFTPFEVSGVPEPEEWILIGIGMIALLIIYQRQRITQS